MSPAKTVPGKMVPGKMVPGEVIPGEVIPADGDITLNEGAETINLSLIHI